jgi:hypothetical protein
MIIYLLAGKKQPAVTKIIAYIFSFKTRQTNDGEASVLQVRARDGARITNYKTKKTSKERRKATSANNQPASKRRKTELC